MTRSGHFKKQNGGPEGPPFEKTAGESLRNAPAMCEAKAQDTKAEKG
ncbi:MAG: hypothetical protein ACI9JL_000199 [Paracoccaceae bacterium]|jgi:hypothetical protein